MGVRPELRTICANCKGFVEKIPQESLYDAEGKLQHYKTCFCANTHVLVDDPYPEKWQPYDKYRNTNNS